MIPKVSEKLFLPTQSEHFLFQLRPASDYTFVEKEELIYPLTSLVAEVLVIIIMVMVIMVMVIMVMVIMVMVMVVLVMVIISIFFVSLPRRPGAAYIIFKALLRWEAPSVSSSASLSSPSGMDAITFSPSTIQLLLKHFSFKKDLG